MKRTIAAVLAAGALSFAPVAAAHLPPPGVTASPVNEDLARLQALIRVESVNPPGGEEQAARLLAAWITQEGIPAKVYVTTPGRACVVARLMAGTAPSAEGAVLLLGHLDVVPVEAARWHHAPFAGEVADGKLWGRGTLDMKDLVVMELRAFLAIARNHRKLARDVIFCATPDEEAGGEQGAGWLIANHPDEVRCAEVLNEGGSGLLTEGGRPMMGIQVAERGALWVRVTAGGRPGHGAQDRPDSAPRKLLRALARLEAQPRTFELGPETGPMLRAMAQAQTGTKSLFLNALSTPWLMPLLASTAVAREPLLGPLLGTTINPTVLVAGQKVNVVPAEASAEIDIRMLPGHSSAQTLAWLKRALGDDQLGIEVLHASEPSRSPTDGRLYGALAQASRAEYPNLVVTPILTPGGGTDSPYFRRLGARCYGCAPILASATQISSIHGDDEYISVEQLAAGGRVVESAVALAATAP